MSVEDEIRELERRRWAALTAADVETLRSLYSPDLAYTHSNGKFESREPYLRRFAKGIIRYVDVQRSDEVVRPFGDAAVVTGSAKMVVTLGDRTLHPVMRYSAIWSRSSGEWQLVCWHAADVV